MATIVDRVTEKVCALSNEQIGRTISIGSDWQWLRIAVLYEFYSSSVAHQTMVSPKMYVGLSAGTSSMAGNSNTRYFLGFTTDSTLTLSRIGVDGRPGYYIGNTSSYITVKSGSSEFNSSARMSVYYPSFSTGSDRIRNYLFIDYVKSNTTPGDWSIYLFHKVTGSAAITDFTPANFYAFIPTETASASTYNRWSFTMPVSESTYGNLDTVNISWNSSQSLEISEVAVWKFR
jgi:hypothetical protein